MPEISFEQLPQRARDYYETGAGAFNKGVKVADSRTAARSFDYAIDMMARCLELEPMFHEARRVLRKAEVRKLKLSRASGLTHAVSTAIGYPGYVRTMALLKAGKTNQALASAEKLLRKDALNLKFLQAFAAVAEAADLSAAAVHALELARETHAESAQFVRLLGDAYRRTGQMRESLGCFEKLCELLPTDFDARKSLKDVTALASMSGDGWQETADTGGSYREMIRDTEEATVLERESKAVRSERDTDVLIRDTLEKIEKEPGNVNFYRALARLYVQTKRFTEGVQTLERALEISPGDPELAATMSAARVDRLTHEIAELRAAGDKEGALAKDEEKATFVFEDMGARVKRYPNDLGLRFQWGTMLSDKGQLNDAIQQFQLSQRSPKHRIASFYYLAMCFKQKGQYDMALEQLKTASSELPVMDRWKKEVLYELGQVSEAVGDGAKAVEYYKQVYQVDIGYKDVAEKVEQVYGQ